MEYCQEKIDLIQLKDYNYFDDNISQYIKEKLIPEKVINSSKINVDEVSKTKNDKTKNEIFRILKYFEQGGTFKDRKISDTRSKFNTNIIDILIKNKVIDIYINPKKQGMGKQYKVNIEYKKIAKTSKEGRVYPEFEKIMTYFL